jgi:hypothetical protein
LPKNRATFSAATIRRCTSDTISPREITSGKRRSLTGRITGFLFAFGRQIFSALADFTEKSHLLRLVLIRMFSEHGRGELCVKSNMVYKLCKDIVYTFGLQFECVWNPNGA